MNDYCSCSDKITLDYECRQNCASTQQDQNLDSVCDLCNVTLPFCEECSQLGDLCYKCSSSSYLEQNLCVSCGKYNLFCDTCTRQECLQCQQGKKLTNQACEDQCIETEQDIDLDGICQPCSLEFGNCYKCKDSECLQCRQGYFLQAQQCVQCSVRIPNCSECSADGTQCNKCENSLLKLTQNQCQQSCIETEQDYNQDGICQPCSQSMQDCEKCEKNIQYCLSCRQGLLQFDGQCVNKCPNESYFVQDQNCKKCNQSLQNCDKCKESGLTCTKCYKPFILSVKGDCIDSCEQNQTIQNGACISCSVIQFCKRCKISQDQDIECTKCHDGFSLVEHQCLETNSIEETQNSTEIENEDDQVSHNKIDDFEITKDEKQFIQETYSATSAQVYLAFAETLLAISSTASSTQSLTSKTHFLSVVLTNQLILMNAFVDVKRTENINEYYYMNFKGNQPMSGINNNDLLNFDLDSKKLKVDRNIYILMNFSSYTLIANLKSAIFIIIILYLIDFLLIAFSRLKWRERIEKLRRKLTNKNLISMTYNLKATQITNAVMLQLYHFSVSDWYTGLNSFLALVILSIQLYFIFQSYKINQKYYRLRMKNEQTDEEKKEMEEMKEKWIIHFECKEQRSKPQVMFQTFFLVRRVFISFTAVILVEALTVQITMYLLHCFIQLFYLVKCRPFTSKILFIQEIVGEVVLIVIYSFNYWYLAISQKQLTDKEIKQAYDLGTVSVFICCLYTIIALLISLFLLLKDFYIAWRQRKQKRVVKSQELEKSIQIMQRVNRLQSDQAQTSRINLGEEKLGNVQCEELIINDLIIDSTFYDIQESQKWQQRQQKGSKALI